MVDDPDLVTLFYRADWTRLSLSAEVHEVEDWALRTQMQNAPHPWLPTLLRAEVPGERAMYEHRARLRVAPGGRYLVDIHPAEDEAEAEGKNPGDRGRVIRYGTRQGLPPPYPELLRPSWILNAFSLEVTQRVEIAGRPALLVVASPAPGVWRADKSKRPERVEVTADAETGILLRLEEFFDGRTVQLRELTEVTFEPDGEFLIPDDAKDDAATCEHRPPPFSGEGWDTAKTAVNAVKTAANTVGPLLGPVIKHAPRRTGGSGAADDPEAMMPPAGERFDPVVSGLPASDEVLHALFRSGHSAFSATLHLWVDGPALGDQARSWTGDRGWGGIGSIAEAFTGVAGVTHQVTRVALAGDGRYRLDFLRDSRKNGQKAVASDGVRRWKEFDDRVIVGPAFKLVHEVSRGDDVAKMVDTAELLASHVSNVAETEVGGRRGFALRAATDAASGHAVWQRQDCDYVIDAELGIVLRLITYMGDAQVMRSEFRDVVPLSGDGSEFVLDIPPGIRVDHSGGGLIDELDMPPAVRSAFRSAESAAKAAESALQAARGFLDSLRGQR